MLDVVIVSLAHIHVRWGSAQGPRCTFGPQLAICCRWHSQRSILAFSPFRVSSESLGICPYHNVYCIVYSSYLLRLLYIISSSLFPRLQPHWAKIFGHQASPSSQWNQSLCYYCWILWIVPALPHHHSWKDMGFLFTFRLLGSVKWCVD